MNQPIYIYALTDPRTSAVRYIGKSVRPHERLANHCNERADTWRNRWIQKLLREGVKPGLVILEELPSSADWKAAERRWIAAAPEHGWHLTNSTSGGDGVQDLPLEIRERMRLTWLGRKHRPESLKKIGRASVGRTHTEAYRAYMRRIMTGRHVTWNERLRHANEKFSAEQVLEIRASLARGERQSSIAARFGVDKGTISNIHRGLFYRWVA